MYVTVHRGSEQIGGSVIEIGSGQTRLIFDAGTNLPPIDDQEAADDFQLEGLTFGKTDFQGVFISHHHNDHCGLLDRILPKIPVYAGELTERVLHTIADFTGQARPSIYDHLADGQVIQKGNLQITPILTKHSAREAYMFLVQGDEKNVLYTGDFRSVDSIVEQVRGLLNGKPLHLLISEGTNIRADRRGREERFPDEDSIQAEAAKWMREYSGTVFVLCSSTNEDRIQAISRAAQESGRLYYEDYFQAILRGRESEPIRHFVARGVCKQSPQYPQFQRLFAQKKLIGAETLAQRPRKEVIFVRASMQDFMKKYLEARKKNLEYAANERDLLLYSMWSGYKTSPYTRKFLDFCREQGMDIISCHCSGHAYRNTLQELIDGLQPLQLLPVHCEAEDRHLFKDLHPHCLPYGDGKRWEVC